MTETAEAPSKARGRTRDQLIVSAQTIPETGILVISEDEYKLIRKEVGLGYRWQGRRLFVR